MFLIKELVTRRFKLVSSCNKLGQDLPVCTDFFFSRLR